jgi:hypothetical protein
VGFSAVALTPPSYQLGADDVDLPVQYAELLPGGLGLPARNFPFLGHKPIQQLLQLSRVEFGERVHELDMYPVETNGVPGGASHFWSGGEAVAWSSQTAR